MEIELSFAPYRLIFSHPSPFLATKFLSVTQNLIIFKVIQISEITVNYYLILLQITMKFKRQIHMYINIYICIYNNTNY